jgi:hypothetical protein
VNPCAIIKNKDATRPSTECVKMDNVTNPICATEEYAISLFMSVCLQVVKLPYITAMTLKIIIIGEKYSEATGNRGKENLIKPYPPNFSRIPASKTEPATGAST